MDRPAPVPIIQHTIRLPVPLYDALVAAAREAEVSQNALAVEALRVYLGVDEPVPA